jgi:type VI secretion system secreted protein Hcp
MAISSSASSMASKGYSPSTSAAVDYFLKLDGIDGESADSKHKNEIDVESWSWGATQGGTMAYGGGGGAGKVQMNDFHFVMRTNKSSPKLFLSCATGQHIKKAVLTVRKAGGEQVEYLKVTFSDVLVSSFQTGGSGGDVVPTDQISLNFSKIEISYAPQDAKGGIGSPVMAGYDLKSAQKV